MAEMSETAGRHPSTLGIWAFLVLALAGSVFLGSFTVPVIPVVLVFSLALVKAYLVMAYYMHLRFEPLFAVLVLVSAGAVLYCLVLGLLPDIVYPPLG